MGICFSKKATRRTRINPKRIAHQSSTTSINRWARVRSSSVNKNEKFDDAVIRGQAIAAALLFQQQNGDVVTFDRSVSVRRGSNGGHDSKCHQNVSRTSSNQRRNMIVDPTVQSSINYQACYLSLVILIT